MPSCKHIGSHVCAVDGGLVWCGDCGAIAAVDGRILNPPVRHEVPKGARWQVPRHEKGQEDEFDWEVLRAESSDQPTREATILRAFWQYAKGNEFGEVSSCEAEHFYHLFRAGWVVAESHIKPVVKERTDP